MDFDYNNIQVEAPRQGMVAEIGAYDPATDTYGDFEVRGNGVMAGDIPQQQFVNPEAYEPQSADDMYIDTLHEAYPQLQDALQWASTYYPQDVLEQYNQWIEEGNFDEAMPFLEQLMEAFGSADFDPSEYEYEDDSDDEGEYEVTQEMADQVVNELRAMEPLGMEAAQPWMELASQYDDAGMEIYSDMSQLVANFHAGNIDAQSAMEYMVENYSEEEDIIEAYLTLAQ